MALITVVYGPEGDPLGMIEIQRRDSVVSDTEWVPYDVYEHKLGDNRNWHRQYPAIGVVYHRREDGWAKLCYKSIGLLIEVEPPYNDGVRSGEGEAQPS